MYKYIIFFDNHILSYLYTIIFWITLKGSNIIHFHSLFDYYGKPDCYDVSKLIYNTNVPYRFPYRNVNVNNNYFD